MPTDLRPLNTLEVLDAAALLLRRNWAHWYAVSVLGTLPLALLVVVYFQWLGTLIRGTANSVFYGGTALWSCGMAVAWAINSIARGAVTALALGEARGTPLTTGEAWRRARKHAAGCAFIGLASFAVAWMGTGCLIPGMWMVLGWWVAQPVLLDEERPFAGALRRSWRLTAGYRDKAFGLWALVVGLGWLGIWNLHLVVKFISTTVAGILGIDTSFLAPQIEFQNQAYLTLLAVAVFVLLDPLKTVADTVLYLDLRVRREGADLQQRLRSLRSGTAVLLLVATLSPAVPARAEKAVSVQEYRTRLQALRQQIYGANSAKDVDPRGVSEVQDRLVKLPDGQQLTVENRWIGQGARSWSTREEKISLLHRLDAAERILGAPAPSSGTGAPPTPGAVDADARATVQQILAQPEFQPLADRPELHDLSSRIGKVNSQNWWTGFWDWLRKKLFKPAEPNLPKMRGPNWKLPELNIPFPNLGFLSFLWAVPVGKALLFLAALFLVVLLIKWIVEQPWAKGRATGAPIVEAPPLEASATENALDHTVDEWELFAQQWLGRGDVRQAIRALYLATLVHLHRQRLIEYNRALTNWVYVRHFRGDADGKGVLGSLTQVFDDTWYGERACGEEQYREFERGVRALGTPAPQMGGARG